MRRLAIAIAAAAVLLPSAASAYIPSPQHGAFELKFGPYRPNVDEGPGIIDCGANISSRPCEPYRTLFKNDTMFLTTLELDWQFWRFMLASLGLGGSMGFMQAYANAKTVSGEDSADYNVLNVMPFALLGVVRIDVLARELRVPLVPYFKGGMAWYLWWTRDGGKTDMTGGSLGWQINPGLMFLLDQFDTMAARTFDNEVGVNHSYVFVELMVAKVEGTGDNNMHLSPTHLWGNATLFGGLALEF